MNRFWEKRAHSCSCNCMQLAIRIFANRKNEKHVGKGEEKSLSQLHMLFPCDRDRRRGRIGRRTMKRKATSFFSSFLAYLIIVNYFFV